MDQRVRPGNGGSMTSLSSYVGKFCTIPYYHSIIRGDFMCLCCHMKLNWIGFGFLSNMPSMSELGQVPKQFWASISPLENVNNLSIRYEGKMS